MKRLTNKLSIKLKNVQTKILFLQSLKCTKHRKKRLKSRATILKQGPSSSSASLTTTTTICRTEEHLPKTVSSCNILKVHYFTMSHH